MLSLGLDFGRRKEKKGLVPNTRRQFVSTTGEFKERLSPKSRMRRYVSKPLHSSRMF